MLLDDSQKELVTKISGRHVYDAFSFLLECHKELLQPVKLTIVDGNRSAFSMSRIDWSQINIDEVKLDQDSPYVFFVKDEISVTQRIVELVLLTNILIEENLLVRTKDVRLKGHNFYLIKMHPLLDSGTVVPENSLSRLVDLVENFFHRDYQTEIPTLEKIRFVPTLRLSDFVKNKFLTTTELNIRKSTVFANLSLGVAVLTSVVSVLIQVWMGIENDKKTDEFVADYKRRSDQLLTTIVAEKESLAGFLQSIEEQTLIGLISSEPVEPPEGMIENATRVK